MFNELSISTRRRVEFIDITYRLEDLIKNTKIEEGVCCVFIPHTTAGVTINENADPSVVYDIITNLEKTVPTDASYDHAEGNSAAHIKSSIIGHSTVILIRNKRLALGTWQGVFFCEFDGPRQRKAWVMVR